MKAPFAFHPEEQISPRQIRHKEKTRKLVQCAEEKGLKVTRTAFGVGHFVFFPDGKRVRYTSYTKLTEFIETYIAA